MKSCGKNNAKKKNELRKRNIYRQCEKIMERFFSRRVVSEKPNSVAVVAVFINQLTQDIPIVDGSVLTRCARLMAFLLDKSKTSEPNKSNNNILSYITWNTKMIISGKRNQKTVTLYQILNI